MVEDGEFLHLTCKPKLTIKAPNGQDYIDLETIMIGSNPILQISQGIKGLKDLKAYGFLGTSSDPAKGYGGGAILMGYGLTSKYTPPCITLTETQMVIPYANAFPSPSPGSTEVGRLFCRSDEKVLYIWSGSSWLPVRSYLEDFLFFDTLFLFKGDGLTPANLELGNLTIHGQCYFDWLRPLTGYNIGMLRNGVMEILIGEDRADDSCLVVGYHKDINAGYIQLYGDEPYSCITIQDYANVVITTLWVDNFYEYDALDDLDLLKNYSTKRVTLPNSDVEVDVIDDSSFGFLRENKAAGGTAWSINKSIGFLFGVAKQHLMRTEELEQRVATLENIAKQASN